MQILSCSIVRAHVIIKYVSIKTSYGKKDLKEWQLTTLNCLLHYIWLTAS